MADRIQALEQIQLRIAARARIQDEFGQITRIAGVDQAFLGDRVISGAVLVSPQLELIARAHAIRELEFPYIPGYLWFREGPAALEAIRKLTPSPDLIIVDGAGINHPRGAGLATHLGVELDLPSIGITKRILWGKPDFIPRARFQHAALRSDSRIIGYLVCIHPDWKPIVVGPGHKISAQTALSFTLSLLGKHKLPEPLRLAHEYAHQLKQQLKLDGKS